MADASYLQTSFLGGLWSKWMQGRADDKRYGTAMNVCLNGYPVEEGSWVRRQGTMHLGYTRQGNQARVLPFEVHETQPYTLEISSDHLRIWFGNQLVCTPDPQSVVGISTDNPALVTTASPHGWSTGDMVLLGFAGATGTAVGASLRNRQFVITVVNAQQFTIADSVTNQGIDGSQANVTGAPTITATRILDFPTPWNWDDVYPGLRSVQTENTAFLLTAGHQPYALVFTDSANSGQFAEFTFGPAQFLDGPYLDWVENSIVTVGAVSGTVAITVGYLPWLSTTVYDAGAVVTYNSQDWKALQGANLNQTPAHGSAYWIEAGSGSAVGPTGFQNTDVGRPMRFQVAPNPWINTTAYATGDVATYQGVGYTALAGSTGAEPDVSPTLWEATPSLVYWTWGVVVSITSENQANVQILGQPFASADNIIYTWMMGAYSDTTGWPTCGCYHEGRLWLGGSAANRIDSSMAGNALDFSPTEPDGTVTDADGISYLLASEGTNPILWMHPSAQGIIAETKMGEWLIQASAMNDPLTPTTIQAHIMTHYGGADILPVQAGLSTVFVQKFGKSVMEYLADVFTGRYIAPNLSETSRDLGAIGFAELAFQLEETPIVWARMNDGSLAGMTFRRKSSFATELPAFAGWHVHQLGSGFNLLSICVSSNVDGTMKALTLVTEDPSNNNCHVERLTDLFTPGAPLTDAWFLDNAVTPSGAQVQTINGVQGTTYYGLEHLDGKLATVWAGGLDCGDFTVENGQVFVPFETANPFYTQTYMNSLSGSYPFGVPIDYSAVAQAAPLSPTPVTAWGIPDANGTTVAPTYVDLGNSKVYAVNPFGALAGTISVFDLFTGALLASAIPTGNSIENYSPTGIMALAAGSPITTGTDNDFYYQSTNGNGGYILMKVTVQAGVLARVGQFGDFGDYFAGEGWGGTTLPNLTNMECVFAGGNYLVGGSVSEGLGNTQLGVINTDSMTFSGFDVTTAAAQALLCAGPQGANFGVVYCLDTWFSHAPTTVHLSVLTIQAAAAAYPYAAPWSASSFYDGGQRVSYEGLEYVAAYEAGTNFNEPPSSSPTYWQYVPNPNITFLPLAPIAPSDIDPEATTFSGTYGPQSLIYDASDGNVIASFLDPINAANPIVLVKISTASGKVLWKIRPVAPDGSQYLSPSNNSRVQNGVLLLLAHSNSDPQYVGRVDLSTGEMESYPVYGVYNFSGAASDDTTGNVYLIQSAVYNDGSGKQATLINGAAYSENTAFWVLQPGNLGLGFAKSTTRDTIPVVIGQKYTSQGQILRPLAPQSIGAMNGPGLGKTRRTHMLSLLVEGSISGTVEIGTSFTATLRPVQYANPDGTPYDIKTLYSGTYWDTFEDDYSFDSQPCWQITRPYPCTINAVEAFIQTQDR